MAPINAERKLSKRVMAPPLHLARVGIVGWGLALCACHPSTETPETTAYKTLTVQADQDLLACDRQGCY